MLTSVDVVMDMNMFLYYVNKLELLRSKVVSFVTS